MKNILSILFLLSSQNIICQEIEIFHNISSNQTHYVPIEKDKKLTIHFSFYLPGIINYKDSPYFFVSGWYELEDNLKKNLVGIYRPSNSLVLYVLEDTSITHMYCTDNNGINIDTINFKERFYFPSIDKNKNLQEAIWLNKKQELLINNIDFEKNNVYHKIFIRGGYLSRYIDHSVEITDFVINPFGENNIFLEDYNINVHSSNTDSLGNLHVLLFITNEYSYASSLSSGGYYYLMLDKYYSIRRNTYFETYNQGKYISNLDHNFSHPTKERFLIIDDWSESQIIGSFLIEKSIITIEKDWRN